jgi:Zn-dependent protease with chaperone function
MRGRIQGPVIHRVLLVDDINAAIVPHPRFGLYGWERNYLILGLPLLQSLSEEEAMAVVAHEYGHLSGHHGRLGGFIYRFRAAWARLQQLSGQWTDWGSRLIARIFQWYAPYFNAYTFVLARQNEYLADQASVEIAGRDNAASALMRVNIASGFASATFWPSISRRIAVEPEPPGNRSAFWEASLRDELDPQLRARFLDQARQRETDRLNTHPALKDRLAAIGAHVDDDTARRLGPPAVSAAAAWLGPCLARITSEFDDQWRQGIAENWRSRHAYLRPRLERLTALESCQDLGTDERWERIELAGELRPGEDLLPALEELLAAAPEHLHGRFRRGELRLDRGEEAGIEDLEFVMARDANAIDPGCKLAWRYYLSRDPGKAEGYRARVLARAAQLQAVKAECSCLAADAEFGVDELTPEAKARVVEILRERGDRVSRAYVLRRFLKADRGVVQHVLALRIGLNPLGAKPEEVVSRVAAAEFPAAFLIIHLGAEADQQVGRAIERLGLQPLPFP